MPEPEVEVVFVGPLVLGEAHVTLNAEDRAVDPRIETRRRRDFSEAGSDRGDEGAGRLGIAGFVFGAVGVEPGLVVALRDAAQELERGLRETLEVGHCGVPTN